MNESPWKVGAEVYKDCGWSQQIWSSRLLLILKR